MRIQSLPAICLSILTVIFCGFALPCVRAAGSHHVVVVVWDGMRPDFVTEQNTPTLWKLAQDGVTFRNHHAVYLSATNVNGTALATGAYPGHSGLIANQEYRPEINNRKWTDVQDPAVVRKGDELSNGKYLAVPTVAELVQAAGQRTVIAAAKGVGLLEDRHVDPTRAKDSVTLFEGNSLPPAALAPISGALGPFPKLSAFTFAKSDAWTTKALTDFFWKDRVPAFSLLWLSEPDGTQHQTAPGAPEALAAMKSSDENLARVLAALGRQHARETTDVFVVSDHGFSTIEHAVDLRMILKDAGFDVATEFAAEPTAGQIMVVANGGSVLFHIIGHDSAVTRQLVEFLQRSDFAGVIFTKESMEGTFTLDKAKIDPPSLGYGAPSNEHAPDVVMSFRWNENKNQFGVPGMIDADWQRGAGKGTHATLSRFDMHNTLIATGPDFRRGQTDELPSGNVDVAPTILAILGIKPPQPMDGRVLSEAVINADKQGLKPETQTIEVTKSFSSGSWRQSLKISRVGSTIYLDEGNGEFVR
jgi:predicted AlkP superfamily pyrophosphatase or phosphodiesterase